MSKFPLFLAFFQSEINDLFQYFWILLTFFLFFYIKFKAIVSFIILDTCKTYNFAFLVVAANQKCYGYNATVVTLALIIAMISARCWVVCVCVCVCLWIQGRHGMGTICAP